MSSTRFSRAQLPYRILIEDSFFFSPASFLGRSIDFLLPFSIAMQRRLQGKCVIPLLSLFVVHIDVRFASFPVSCAAIWVRELPDMMSTKFSDI